MATSAGKPKLLPVNADKLRDTVHLGQLHVSAGGPVVYHYPNLGAGHRVIAVKSTGTAAPVDEHNVSSLHVRPGNSAKIHLELKEPTMISVGFLQNPKIPEAERFTPIGASVPEQDVDPVHTQALWSKGQTIFLPPGSHDVPVKIDPSVYTDSFDHRFVDQTADTLMAHGTARPSGRHFTETDSLLGAAIKKAKAGNGSIAEERIEDAKSIFVYDPAVVKPHVDKLIKANGENTPSLAVMLSSQPVCTPFATVSYPDVPPVHADGNTNEFHTDKIIHVMTKAAFNAAVAKAAATSSGDTGLGVAAAAPERVSSPPLVRNQSMGRRSDSDEEEDDEEEDKGSPPLERKHPHHGKDKKHKSNRFF